MTQQNATNGQAPSRTPVRDFIVGTPAGSLDPEAHGVVNLAEYKAFVEGHEALKRAVVQRDAQIRADREQIRALEARNRWLEQEHRTLRKVAAGALTIAERNHPPSDRH